MLRKEAFQKGVNLFRLNLNKKRFLCYHFLLFKCLFLKLIWIEIQKVFQYVILCLCLRTSTRIRKYLSSKNKKA